MRLLPEVKKKLNKTLVVLGVAAGLLTLAPFDAFAETSNKSDYPFILQDLQKIHDTYMEPGNFDELPDQGLEIALDIRRDAQKEAALSFGARGGLARRNFELMEQLEGYHAVLDKVYDFRPLLIKAPSGLMIEPPVISEAIDALVIEDGGIEAAVADKIYNIGQEAKIVTAPKNWRQYLVQNWSDVPPPPQVLWPANEKEQAEWESWVAKGWNAGYRQADDIFSANLSRLIADFTGMVRYRLLLAQDMVTKPYALHEDRGVTGGPNEMRVGDRAIRITGPSQFQVGSESWIPADR